MGTQIALCDARGPLTSLIDELSGKNGAEWLRALKRFNRKQDPWAAQADDWRIWKTVKLGAFKTGDEYLRALKKANVNIDDGVEQLLNHPEFTCAKQEIEIDLAVMQVWQLGFRPEAHYVDIWKRAIERGFSLCPAEVGPALRLAYGDQPQIDRLVIGMQSLPCEKGGRGIFVVDNPHPEPFGVWLRTDDGRRKAKLPMHWQLVFQRPRGIALPKVSDGSLSEAEQAFASRSSLATARRDES